MRKRNSIVNSQPASFCREERTSTTPAMTDTPSITVAVATVAAAAAIPAAASKVQSAAPASTPAPSHELIKLAIDAHAKFFMVARQVDNAVAQPPQKFDREQLLRFIAKQKSMAR